jgi:hypothetical protein
MADCRVVVVVEIHVDEGGKNGWRIDGVAFGRVEVKEGEDDRMGTWVSHLIKR